MTIRNELIDELLAGRDPGSVMRQDGLLGELKQALLNRLMAAELDHHLTQERTAGESKNHRNGSTRKRVQTGHGSVEVHSARPPSPLRPCFDWQIPAPAAELDDRMISLYARGMSTREIRGHLEE